MTVTMGEYELSLRSQAIEARRRLMGKAAFEPRVRVAIPEPEPAVSRAALPHAKVSRKAQKPKAITTKAAEPPARKNKATGNWTPERISKMLHMWRDGFSASEIAERLGGVSRSAVCGKVWRLRNPLDAALSSRARKSVPKKANKPKAPKAESRSNVPGAVAAKPKAATVVVALPVRGVSDADLVTGWLAQHGGPRRFERGDSADPLSLKIFLRERGYEMSYRWRGGGKPTLRKIGARGAPKRMTLRDVVSFVDRLRAMEGLERIGA